MLELPVEAGGLGTLQSRLGAVRLGLEDLTGN